MDPEYAQQAYRRPENPQRRKLERDIEAFLAAGGEIKEVSSDQFGYDPTAKQVPYERQYRDGGINGNKTEQGEA